MTTQKSFEHRYIILYFVRYNQKITKIIEFSKYLYLLGFPFLIILFLDLLGVEKYIPGSDNDKFLIFGLIVMSLWIGSFFWYLNLEKRFENFISYLYFDEYRDKFFIQERYVKSSSSSDDKERYQNHETELKSGQIFKLVGGNIRLVDTSTGIDIRPYNYLVNSPFVYENVYDFIKRINSEITLKNS
jgi:hypothetical protein